MSASGEPIQIGTLTNEEQAAWEWIVSSMPPGVLAAADSMLVSLTAQWWCASQSDALSFKERSDATKHFLACATKIGLTLTDRARLKIGPESKRVKNEKAKFFSEIG